MGKISKYIEVQSGAKISKYLPRAHAHTQTTPPTTPHFLQMALLSIFTRCTIFYRRPTSLVIYVKVSFDFRAFNAGSSVPVDVQLEARPVEALRCAATCSHRPPPHFHF